MTRWANKLFRGLLGNSLALPAALPSRECGALRRGLLRRARKADASVHCEPRNPGSYHTMLRSQITSRRLIDSRPLRRMIMTTFSLGKDERWLTFNKAIDCPTPIRARSCARSWGHIWCGYELCTSTRTRPHFTLRGQLPGLWIARVETALSKDEENSLRNDSR